MAGATGTYVVVEKILTGSEELPDAWPVAGDSGYALMDAVDGSLVAPKGIGGLDHALARSAWTRCPRSTGPRATRSAT